jgi:hypothetical protein
MSARETGCPQTQAAQIAGIDERSGRRIEKGQHRTGPKTRSGRTRVDPLAEVWEQELQPMLTKERICNLPCGNPRLATHLKLRLAKGSMDFTAIKSIFRPSGGSSQFLVWNRPEKASCGLTQTTLQTPSFTSEHYFETFILLANFPKFPELLLIFFVSVGLARP